MLGFGRPPAGTGRGASEVNIQLKLQLLFFTIFVLCTLYALPGHLCDSSDGSLEEIAVTLSVDALLSPHEGGIVPLRGLQMGAEITAVL